MKKLNILIADDIFVNQFLLSSIIEEIGHIAKTVSNGKDAIAELEKGNYSIVLLDIEMPVMNGIETVRYIRTKMDEKYKNLPVIALTAHNPNDFESELADAKFDEIMTKPYSIAKLSHIIEKYS